MTKKIVKKATKSVTKKIVKKDAVKKVKKRIRKTTLNDVLSTLGKWSKDNTVMFYGTFIKFDKNYDVTEDRLVAFGDKKSIKISLKELTKYLKESEDDFLNW